jgi:hypothetical protein
MARTNTKKKAAPKAAKVKSEAPQRVAAAQREMMSTDIRKDYRKTLLGRFLGGKTSSPGKRP